MSKPWMPLYVADYLADTAHLRAAMSGAYLHLIMHYWQHGKLPHDDHTLATIARMSTREWEKAKPIIAAFFKAGWRHKRIDKEIAAASAAYERRARAGKLSGEARRAMLEQCSNGEGANVRTSKRTMPEQSQPPLLGQESKIGIPEERHPPRRDLGVSEPPPVANGKGGH